jgi:hypothetical protein
MVEGNEHEVARDNENIMVKENNEHVSIATTRILENFENPK